MSRILTVVRYTCERVGESSEMPADQTRVVYFPGRRVGPLVVFWCQVCEQVHDREIPLAIADELRLGGASHDWPVCPNTVPADLHDDPDPRT